MRILIVKTSALGDIVHALPVLSCLKALHEHVIIDWIVESRFSELLRGHPAVSRLLVVDTKKWRRHPLSSEVSFEVVNFVRQLRGQFYDVVFDLQGNFKSGLITLFARADTKVGLAPRYMQERINRLFVNTVSGYCNSKHISDVYINTIQSFYNSSCPPDLIPDIYTSPDDDAAAVALLGENTLADLVCIHHGTTWETKLWYDDGWVLVAQQILKTYPQSTIVLSSGSLEELEHSNKLAEKIGDRVIVLPLLPLKQFIALLKRMTLVLGGDTGPVHIAAAVGGSTVSLYRSSEGDRSGPRGRRHICIQSPLKCACCFKTTCSDNLACMHSITPERVFSEVVMLLQQLGMAENKEGDDMKEKAR